MRVIKFEDTNALSFVADDQIWTDEDVRILRDFSIRKVYLQLR